MNDKIKKDVYKVQPLKKICMTIGELPTSYLETMTYYEMLIWFTNFLRDNIIPTVNNNAEAVKELQNLFTELQNYVNNYFDNLDVQEEINNKLDEMVEDGTFETIIIKYFLKSQISYEYFGAKGDGETDDYNAILQTHEYANLHNLKVVADTEKTYYIKSITDSIIVETDVDWNNAKFIIDDTGTITNVPLFIIKSKMNPIDLTNAVNSISIGTEKINSLAGNGDCLVHVVNSNHKDFIRYGDNQDEGYSRTDIFRINNDGVLLDTLEYDFENVTSLTLYPIDS